MDLILLSRIQFSLTVMFHYLFPPLSIGLGLLMVVMEGLFLRTKDPMYEAMAKFWTKIFGVIFAMGVASGIVMEFQFGTNWATYSRYVGDIFGSALAAEGIFAFFLESGFLAILVFGWDRVSKRTHFISTVMVAFGAMISALWIIVANSWQQTPAGFHIVGNGLTARAEITDFWAMVFNPSTVDRFIHTILGAYVNGAFLVISVCAYYILKNKHLVFAKKGFFIGLIFGLVSLVALIASGHTQGVSVSKNQPEKLAAFEGHYNTGPATLYLLGFPNDKTKSVDFGLGIPGGLGFLINGSFSTVVAGLDQYKTEDRPPTQITFQAYHLMVALGMAMLGLIGLGLFFLWRGTLFRMRWLLWFFVPSVIAATVANQTGWIAAEVGRQPWVVYHLLRTSDAVAKAVSANMVASSIVMFSVLYLLLLAVWLFVMLKKINDGPDDQHLSFTEEKKSGLLNAVARLPHLVD